MPGFDGTGPVGMGPRTGGGRGLCSSVNPSRRIYRWGGTHRDWLSWHHRHPYSVPYPPRFDWEEEIDFLRSETDAIKSQLDGIKLRIKDLEKAS